MERRGVHITQQEDYHQRPGAGNGRCGADFEGTTFHPDLELLDPVLDRDQIDEFALGCGLPPGSLKEQIWHFLTYGKVGE
ncbi:hypothetical protein HY407_01495 [Candidatus Gottesmanbacteria bacterium]|nr:hypothetical protein [Candidatus Gottesmanbacteria bacterium]